MKTFQDLAIATKLVGAFALVALLGGGILGYVGITTIQSADASAVSLYEKNTIPLQHLGKLTESFQRQRTNVLEYILAKTGEKRADLRKRIAERTADITAALAAVEQSLQRDDERKIFAALAEHRSTWLLLRGKILEMVDANRLVDAQGLYDGEAGKIRTKVQDDIASLTQLKVQYARTAKESIEADAANSTRTMMIAVAMGMAVAMGLGVGVARIISRPLRQVVAHAKRIAGGDLTVEISQHSNDELSQLAGSFKHMVANLRETIGRIGESSASVASATAQISSSTEELAAGAQEQTSQAGEVASAVEEMTKTIVENSRTASGTADMAKRARTVAEEGGKVVEENIAGMKRIAEVVNKSAETVLTLGRSSNQIGEIVAVIDDIADQTNLLALNAAIEAARAGDMGRGFAVVADEVRKLAERTSKATKEIASMIKHIQSDTTAAVESMKEGTQVVTTGIQLADKAGKSLKEIVTGIQEVTDMVGQIAAASEQQSSASEQISRNVEAISSVTGQAAQGNQQIARAAEDLNRLTENLQNVVSKFKLSEEVAREALSPVPVRRTTGSRKRMVAEPLAEEALA
jgi:methyl-accepting chemotaxis protein